MKAYASVSFFGYSVYVFAHVLICFAVGLYFLSRLSESHAYRANLLLCLATAALVVVAVFGITTGNTAFRGYMIDPLSAVLARGVKRATMAPDSQKKFHPVGLTSEQ